MTLKHLNPINSPPTAPPPNCTYTQCSSDRFSFLWVSWVCVCVWLHCRKILMRTHKVTAHVDEGPDLQRVGMKSVCVCVRERGVGMKSVCVCVWESERGTMQVKRRWWISTCWGAQQQQSTNHITNVQKHTHADGQVQFWVRSLEHD